VSKAIIVGCGPAGATCAMYLARANVACTVIDHGKPVVNSAMLNNFPGVIATGGREWLQTLHRQLDHLGVRIVNDKVTSAKAVDSGFVVTTESGLELRSQVVVLASGQGQARLCSELGVKTRPGEQPYVRENVQTDRWGETEVAGVFACGVLAGWPSQVVICAGSGANTAVGIANRLGGEYWVDHDVA